MGMDGKVMKTKVEAEVPKVLLAWVNRLLKQEYCKVCKLYVGITAKGHQCGKVKGKPELTVLTQRKLVLTQRKLMQIYYMYIQRGLFMFLL